MKKALLISLSPIIVLPILALTQHGEYSYNRLGGVIIYVLAGYVVSLLLASVVLFILRKKEVAKGTLVSFGIGVFVSIVTFGMGL
jgi:F0F1-type ATP synthase assembly protein I